MPSVFPGVDGLLAAVIFDFDGVLVESMDIKAAAFQALFPDHPDKAEAIAALHRRHGGVDRWTKISMIHRDILRESLSDERREMLANRFAQLVEDRVIAAPMVPGAANLLSLLDGRVPMVVVSATPQAEIERIVNRRGLARYFRAVRGSPPSKTEHVRALLAVEAWKPDRVVLIGDAAADFEAAQANGIVFIGRLVRGVPNPFPAGVTTVSNLVPLAEATTHRANSVPERHAGIR